MKSLANETISSMDGAACAALVMDTVPALMRVIRQEIRSHRPTELSVPQFRALRLIQRHPDASLSHVAEHLGLTLASASKLMDILVRDALVTRTHCQDDRRRIALRLTTLGQNTLREVHDAVQARLAKRLDALTVDDRAAVTHAMHALRTTLLEEP